MVQARHEKLCCMTSLRLPLTSGSQGEEPYSERLAIEGTQKAGRLIVACLPDCLSSSPDLQVPNVLHLLLVLLSVIWLRVVVQRPLRLLTSLYAVVELIEDGFQGILELATPVDCTTSGGGRACCVHPIHAVRTNQRVQALSCLLNSLVESFAGAVTFLAENFVLSEEHAVDPPHQAPALAVQIRVDFLFKRGLVKISTADRNAKSYSLLFGFASHVLVDGYGGVDTAPFPEKCTHGAAGTLWCDENDIDIRGNINLGEVLENRGKAVGEIEGLRFD